MDRAHLVRCGLALLLGLTLAGCASSVRLAQPLATTTDALSPAIALGDDGTRHVVWAQCALICHLVYERAPVVGPATRIPLTPPAGESYRAPAIAVTSNGSAYLAWRALRDVHETPYVAVVPASSTSAPMPMALHVSTAAVGLDPPVLVARGAAVYAAYLVKTPTSVQLYSRQVNPLVGSESLIQEGAAIRAIDLAIDSAGGLHVTYRQENDTGTLGGIFYQQPGGSFAVVAPPEISRIYGAPDLALDAADTAVIVYTDRPSTGGQQVAVYGRASGEIEEHRLSVLPAASGPWSVSADPTVVFAEGSAQISLVAANAATSTPEVWTVAVDPLGETATAPLRVSITPDGAPGEARIIAVDGAAAIVWRVRRAGTPACDGDAYLWMFGRGTQRIHASPAGGCTRGSGDVAANGAWAAGVLLDRAPDRAVTVPWVAFNVYQTHLPMVVR
jgi:hypothetical protein